MNTIRKTLFSILIIAFFAPFLFSQNETTPSTEQVTEKPVRSTFSTNMLIDNQTVISPFRGTLNLVIYHRFSDFSNGIKDIYGIYGSANTRLGLEYGITDRLMVGIGTTKLHQLQDIEWKYAILQQTQSGSMPVSLSYFGNMVIDASAKSNFGISSEYKIWHRFSYFSQLILARKFNGVFSAQVAPSFAWYNGVSQDYNNYNIGLSLGARAKVMSSQSVIAEYDMPFLKNSDKNGKDLGPKPNMALGWEIGTSTHCFQIFVANYNQIIYQRNLVYNTRSGIDKKNLQVGFNITVRF